MGREKNKKTQRRRWVKEHTRVRAHIAGAVVADLIHVQPQAVHWQVLVHALHTGGRPHFSVLLPRSTARARLPESPKISHVP